MTGGNYDLDEITAGLSGYGRDPEAAAGGMPGPDDGRSVSLPGTDDLPAGLPLTADRWLRGYRRRGYEDEVPDADNAWWYRMCRAWLPHPVDEPLGLGNVRAFLFAGPEGTGRYTVAQKLCGTMYDRGYSWYDLSGDAFDIWPEDRLEMAVQALFAGRAASDGADGKGLEGRAVILRFPEECEKASRLQKAILSALRFCEDLDLPLFLILITRRPSSLSVRLRSRLVTCAFRLPDEEERRRFIRNYFEETGFRLEANGNAAITKERRESLVTATEGFNYYQLRDIPRLAWLTVKQNVLEKNVYEPEASLQALEAMDYLYLEPEVLREIVDRIRDGGLIADSMEEAPARLIRMPVPAGYPGPAEGGGRAVRTGQSPNKTEAGSRSYDREGLPSDRKKDQPTLAEMYRAITSELG